MTIDPNTGMPALPEGFIWEVRPTQVALLQIQKTPKSHVENLVYSSGTKKRRFPTKEAAEAYVEERYTDADRVAFLFENYADVNTGTWLNPRTEKVLTHVDVVEGAPPVTVGHRRTPEQPPPNGAKYWDEDEHIHLMEREGIEWVPPRQEMTEALAVQLAEEILTVRAEREAKAARMEKITGRYPPKKMGETP